MPYHHAHSRTERTAAPDYPAASHPTLMELLPPDKDSVVHVRERGDAEGTCGDGLPCEYLLSSRNRRRGVLGSKPRVGFAVLPRLRACLHQPGRYFLDAFPRCAAIKQKK
jgi:hypothetical protein